MFRNRIDAGLLLAEKLKKYKNSEGIVLAVPRGGVPVAYAVAKKLGLPLEVILTKKIGHPGNTEYAFGAASLTDYFVVPHDDVTEDYIGSEVKRVQARLREMYENYMGNEPPLSPEGKTVIAIDDGIATGNTLLGTVNLLRKSNPAKIVVAAPVASESAVKKLSAVADEVVILSVPGYFYGVGAWYEDFEQVNDEEVMYYLDKIRNQEKTEERKHVF
jgi:predicted phosphoribosyltransferase